MEKEGVLYNNIYVCSYLLNMSSYIYILFSHAKYVFILYFFIYLKIFTEALLYFMMCYKVCIFHGK